MNWLKRFLKWLRSLFLRRPHILNVHSVERVSEIPDDIGRDVYVVERGGRQSWLVVSCLCEEQHRLMVNLLETKWPRWRVSMRSGRLSVFPSIWLKDECESHFWIRDGNVHDVGASDENNFA
jgi:hypothetical protein